MESNDLIYLESIEKDYYSFPSKAGRNADDQKH